MSKLTKEDLYFLHDAVKQNPFWTNGTKYGLTVLNTMCEQLIKFKVELFKYLGVRKDDEWLKNPQIVLPKIIEYNRIIPITYVGYFVLEAANAFCNDPKGQAPTAPGHE